MIEEGDLIKVNGGHIGLVVGVEYYYPSIPESPPRNFKVKWIKDKPSWAFGLKKEKVNAFSVIEVVSRKHGKLL